MKNVVKVLLYLCCMLLIAQISCGAKDSGHGSGKPSPDAVLEMLKKGNERFYTDALGDRKTTPVMQMVGEKHPKDTR